jgi:F-type H+-transporting ATPase subunit b
MNTLALLLAAAEEEEEHIDRTHHWLWPEGYEIWFGGAASIIIFAALFYFAWTPIKMAMKGRTQRVQDELDAAAADKAAAEAEAAQIRQAKGDIEAERARLLAEADERAQALLADGRTRLEREIAELHTKADADIAAASSRGADELRAEIARLASSSADSIVSAGLDDETQQQLIESYIARVGATGGR